MNAGMDRLLAVHAGGGECASSCYPRWSALCLGMLASAGCSTNRSSPFDPALEFIPDGMHSVVLQSGAHVIQFTESPVDRSVFAGRSFEGTGPGLGDYIGLTIADFGDRRVPNSWRDTSRSGARWQKVAGHDVLFVPGRSGEPKEHWKIALDDRFLLDASRREVLELALARRGRSLAELKTSTGFGGTITDQPSTLTVFRELHGDMPWASGLEVTMRLDFAMKQMVLRARTSDPDKFFRGLQELWRQSGGTTSLERSTFGSDDVLHVVFRFCPDDQGWDPVMAHSIPWLIGFVFYV